MSMGGPSCARNRGRVGHDAGIRRRAMKSREASLATNESASFSEPSRIFSSLRSSKKTSHRRSPPFPPSADS